MSSSHLLAKSLQKKFSQTVSTNFTSVPVSHALPMFLQNQSMRIQQMLNKTQRRQNTIQKMADNLVKNRSDLDNKIKNEQKKHQKKRQQQLQKIQKNQKFKIEKVEQINKKFNEKQSSFNKKNREIFFKTKEEMINFWNQQKDLTTKKFRVQSRSKSLYENAVNRKKHFQKTQIEQSSIHKDRLLSRHSQISERKRKIVTDRKNQYHIPHLMQLQENLQRNNQIMEERRNKFIQSIGMSMDRSSNLIKYNSAINLKERQIKNQNIQYKKSTVKSHFIKEGKDKSKKLSECKCFKKDNSEPGITKSIIINEQQHRQEKINSNQPKISNLTLSRNNFMRSSLINWSKVASQKQFIRYEKNLSNEKRLMREKYISEALKLKHNIETEANNLIRKINIISK